MSKSSTDVSKNPVFELKGTVFLKQLDIKIKIGLLIALLLLVGMVLLDLVMVFASQQYVIRVEKEKGDVLLDLLCAQIDGDDIVQGRYDNDRTDTVLAVSNMAAAVCVDARGNLYRLGGRDDTAAASLGRLVQIARKKQESRSEFTGETWGLFWRERKYLALAKPVFGASGNVAAAGVSVSLEPVYAQLRTTQKIVGWYLLINTILLSLVGLYRIHHLAIRPILKVIRRAEAFRPGDSTFLLEEGGENEISRLSTAFNRILDLNREDQEQLQYTVSRLETAMTDLKQAQQEIIRAEKFATVGRLSSGIAHEIGNPIGIVLGYLDLIKRPDTVDVEKEDYIHRVTDEIERIRSIIRQLLNYSRPYGEGHQSVSTHTVLGDVIQMARVQPLFADVAVDTELSALNDTVSADPDQLRQLFLNFMLNAADAIKMGDQKDPGRIRIKSENPAASGSGGKESSGMIRVVFEDNGIGLAEGDLNKIFDPFFTTKPPGMGSGLGLWVSLLISESMGGKIEAGNNPGGGAQIILSLPVSGKRVADTRNEKNV